MNERWDLRRIREYWSMQVAEHGTSPLASWSDVRVIELETRELVKWLADGDHVLDVGCANGYSTVQLATAHDLHVRGIDYVPEMIAAAHARAAGLPKELRARIDFKVGNVLELDEEDAAYDKVVVVRVIINLGDWTAQQQGLNECARVVRPGGLLLLSEATLQGWNRLNGLRREWGLPDIPMPPFNAYLDEERVAEALEPDLELIDLVNFASTYFVGTRLLKPLLAAATKAPLDVANPQSEWNRWLAELPAWGDYGTQKLFVFRRSR